MIKQFIATVTMMACVALVCPNANGQIGPGNYPNHLFAQHTTQGQGGLTAGQYVAPHPVPANVGHGYRTYEPLMPHEMLYEHSRNYYNYYNDNSFQGGGGALNITSVRWQNGHSSFRPLPLSGSYLSNLQYKAAKRVYCIDGDCESGTAVGGKRRGKLRSKQVGGRFRARAAGGVKGAVAETAGDCATCSAN